MARVWRAASVLCLFVFSFAESAEISFDLDGSGSYAPMRQLTPSGMFDYFEGSGVIAGALPVLGNPVATVGANLQSYFQSQLQTVTFNDATIDSPFFMTPANGYFGTPTEVTMQAALPMLYTAFTGTELILDVGVGTNYFRMFYDPTRDSNIVSGLGFDGSGDSQLILEATFTQLDFSVGIGLDTAEFLALATVNYVDSNFFDVPPVVIVLALDLDGLVHIPPQIFPSASIVGYTPGAADMRMSMDLSARLEQLEVVPESTSILLVAAGFSAAGPLVWKRRRSG